MNDLDLWNILNPARRAEGDHVASDAEQLRALLEELAALPLADRWPHFGRLDCALSHASPAVRAAAVKVLAGATGFLGLRAIVRTMDDTDPATRAAAVASLGVSAAADADRWAHAAFHRRDDVRLAALAHPPGHDLPWYALLLTPDPACRETVLANPPAKRAPASAVHALMNLARTGHLPREAAADAVAAMPVEDLYDQLRRGGAWRSDEAVARLLAAAAGRAAPAVEALRTDPDADGLDELLELFWDAVPFERALAATHSTRERFFERLTSWAIDRSRHAQAERVRCAAFRVAARRGAWDPLAAELALVIDPVFLQLKWVEPAVRVASVRALYQYGARLDPLPPEQVSELLALPVCRPPCGELDLWVVGGLLRWSGGEPYKLAAKVLGVTNIVNAFLADPAGSASMFAAGRDPEGRKRLLAAIAKRTPHSVGSILAGLVLVLAADELQFLDGLDGRSATEVYAELLAMCRRPGVALSDNKVRRLADELGPKIEPDHVGDFLRATADVAGADDDPLAQRTLSTVARLAGADKLTAAARKLDPIPLSRVLGVIPNGAGFPYGVEAALAHGLADHKDEAVRTWAAGRVARPARHADVPAAVAGAPVRKLTRTERTKISTCATTDLKAAVAPCLHGPTSGLCDALADRRPPGMHSIAACVALLGCHDPPHRVAEQFAVFSEDDPAFLSAVEVAAVKQWAWNQQLPLLGNCWLHLWDPHCFAAGDVLCAWEGGLAGALRWALGLPAVVLGRQVFETVARLLGMWRRRDKAKLAAVDLPALCPLLVEQLPGDMGVPAAKALVTVFESGAAAETAAALQPRVMELLPALPERVRESLRAWVDSRGLTAAPTRRAVVPADPAVLRRIAASRDLDQLEAFCRGTSNQEVQDATLRLIELGEAGTVRLAALLTATVPPPLAVVIAESLPLWSDGPPVDAVRGAFLAADGSSEVLFTIGMGLVERGDATCVPPLLDVCRRPAEQAWFLAAHWDRLVAHAMPAPDLAVELATSPHPFAYRPAVETLLRAAEGDERSTAAVAAFLRCGSGRLLALRLRAAEWLRRRGDYTGFPLLVRRVLAAKVEQDDASADDRNFFAHAPAALIEQAVLAVLAAGPQVASEARLLDRLVGPLVNAQARDDAYAALLKDAALDATRTAVVSGMRAGESRAAKLRRLARTFAWGVVTGRELTGRIFSIEMNAGDGLGYTRFESDKVWITPLPILRGDRHAEAVTRGLIAHELGHHLYHRNPDALKVWEEVHKAGYHGLLNLVSDEHLERNLRALDDRHGDDLKKLAAYAFQHSDKEVAVAALLTALQARAFDVLTRTPLGVARRRGCVAVNNGALLAEMERAGMSFSRFVRALRMGLGNRSRDPKVAAGLELFKGAKFRKQTMAGLRDLSLQLRQIFGWETVLVESLGQDGLLTPGAGELLASAEGIGADELREAVRRLLEERKQGRPRKEGPPIRVINQGPEESFAPITTVVPVPFDPAKHQAYAAQVAAPARQMRQYFSQLGLQMEPQRYRVQGKRVDRARVVPAGVLRGDPRLLIARQVKVRPDLFLGLVIDCSGSMQMSARIEQGKLFGTLLAEAARGLRGIDVRVFGFTDSVIYDAGDAGHCAAHNLEANGGNNDAAALWHAATAARASRRRAKLLVMISDGAPTECTTAALKALVSRLTYRMGMCCAQVAVCPLEERCFPHYVVLKEQNVIESVRQFGSVITKLVHRAVRG